MALHRRTSQNFLETLAGSSRINMGRPMRDERRSRVALAASLAAQLLCGVTEGTSVGGSSTVSAGGAVLRRDGSAFAAPPLTLRNSGHVAGRHHGKAGRAGILRPSLPWRMSMEINPRDSWGNNVNNKRYGTNNAFFFHTAAQNMTLIAATVQTNRIAGVAMDHPAAAFAVEEAPVLGAGTRDWYSKDIGRSVLTMQELGGTPPEARPLSGLVMGKIVIDEFVLRKQPDTKIVRAGLGGGSPQAALAAQLWDDKSKVGLVAPVGQKFDQAMLQGLDLAGVDTTGVTRLTGYVTPRMQIRYDSDKTVWTPGEGWDRWEELKQENLPLAPELDGAPLVHIITEGSGGAETQMAFDYLARNPPALLSIEPVMPDVSAGAVEALTPHAAAADLVCPDWETALGISHLQGCAGLDVRGSDAHAHLMRRYEVVPGLTHGGRPVYCAEADGALPRGFLYHVPGSAGASRWYLGPKVGSDVACLFVASEAVTPDLVRGPWQEYHAAAQEWREAPEMDVVRVVADVVVRDRDGVRRTFTVEHGELLVRILPPGAFQEEAVAVKHLHYSTEHGRVSDGDDDWAFYLPEEDREALVAQLSGLCASAGVHWDADGSAVRDAEAVDEPLHVAGAARQNVWRAVVDGESAESYYWNTCTGETVWHRPPEMLRVSYAQETTRDCVRNVRGDVSRFAIDGPPPEADLGSAAPPREEPSPEEQAREEAKVLLRAAARLGIEKGVLAVRCGARGALVLDCRDPSRFWRVPALEVPVQDPHGAGNAFSAAFAVGLADAAAAGLPREDAVLQAACRAAATGAAFVAAEGMPVASGRLRGWMAREADALRARVEEVRLHGVPPAAPEEADAPRAGEAPPLAGAPAVSESAAPQSAAPQEPRWISEEEESTWGPPWGRGSVGSGSTGAGSYLDSL